MICGVIAGRFPNEKQRWPGSAPVMAFSMSNMPRDTVTRCLPPSATLALRASFQKTERPTLWAIETLDQGQRIRRHRRRRVFWTGHSDTTAKRTRGQSTCACNSVGVHDKTNRRPPHAETHRRCRTASPRRGALLSLKRKASRTLEVTGSPWR